MKGFSNVTDCKQQAQFGTYFLATFLVIVLAIPGHILAQDQTNDPNVVKITEQDSEIKQKLKQKLKKKDKSLTTKSSVNLNTLDNRVIQFDFDQQWQSSDNPNPQWNFDIYSPGWPAGDINGDGTQDIVATVEGARDERTPNNLGDLTGKTAVFYGGSSGGSITGQQPDAFFYEHFVPVGDLNNDGYSDALALENPTSENLTIYTGSGNGYQETGITIPAFYGFNTGQIIGFSNFNNDNFGDVLFGDTSQGGFTILYGSSDLSNTTQQEYSVATPIVSNQFNSAGFDTDSKDRIVRLAGTTQKQLFIYEIDETNLANKQVVQQFSVGLNQTWQAVDYSLQTLDIKGNDGDDILLSLPNTQIHTGIAYDSTANQYNTSSDTLFEGQLSPIGDLNDDSRQDFIIDNANDDDAQPWIAFGKDSLHKQPTPDVELSGDSDSDWDGSALIDLYSRSSYGDLTGDGIDDGILTHYQYTGVGTFGRRLLTGSSSGNYSSSFVNYPAENFTNYVYETREVGDLNGDGIEDVAFNRATGNKDFIDIYFGSTDGLPDSPDLSVEVAFGPLGMADGDFNGDGFSDIAISANDGTALAFIAGGTNMDANVDHTISRENSSFYLVGNAGDINDDGSDDLVANSIFATDENDNRLDNYPIFFGGDGSFPTAVSQAVPTSQDVATSANDRTKSVGDVNGDGVDDLAISTVSAPNSSNNSQGKIKVYYGGASKDFSSASPDLVLTGNTESIFIHGVGISGGDFNGDGVNDIAVRNIVNPGSPLIDFYHGGNDIDNTVDNSISSSALDPTTYHFSFRDIATVEDYDGDNRDELLVPEALVGNLGAPILETNGGLVSEYLLPSNNKGALLGPANIYTDFSSIGDFNDNGSIDVILAQSNDDNNALNSSRVYNYEMDRPISISSVEDVPEDQGEWVRVNVGGYLTEGLAQGVLGSGSYNYAVMRMTENDSWTNVSGRIEAYKDGANFVDVRVPKTQPSNDNSVDYSYKFKVVAYNSNTGVAESRIDSGKAFDNIAPSAVSNVSAERSESTVNLSWDALSADDIQSYNVYSVDNSGNLSQDPVGSTVQNSISLSDGSFEGVQKFAVRAKDDHNNNGTPSNAANAIFSISLDKSLQQGWNIVGVPLDADPSEYEQFLPEIQNGALYSFNGSYSQVSSVSDMEPGVGYWAKVSSGAALNGSGLPLTDLTIQLDEGWNMISGVGEAISADQVQDPSGVIVDGTLTGFDGSYQEASQLTPGNAYWVRASEAGEISLSLLNTSTNQQNRLAEGESDELKPIQEVKEEFNTIEINSAEGHSRTLYFGEELPDKVNKLSFSLPPLPPGKIFDARFSGTSMKLSQDDHVAIDVQNPKNNKPVTLNLNLKPTYKYQTFEVREVAKGTTLDEYLVDGNKEVTLKNEETSTIELVPIGLKGLTASDNPDEFKLHQNYPNPFNPTTTIRYAVAEQAEVSMQVYNVVGKRVATLVNEQKSPGNYKVTFDASNLSSGLYFVKIQAGSFHDVQKLTLIK